MMPQQTGEQRETKLFIFKIVPRYTVFECRSEWNHEHPNPVTNHNQVQSAKLQLTVMIEAKSNAATDRTVVCIVNDLLHEASYVILQYIYPYEQLFQLCWWSPQQHGKIIETGKNPDEVAHFWLIWQILIIRFPSTITLPWNTIVNENQDAQSFLRLILKLSATSMLKSCIVFKLKFRKLQKLDRVMFCIKAVSNFQKGTQKWPNQRDKMVHYVFYGTLR